jgi:periplasmic mercuric ion binding protein
MKTRIFLSLILLLLLNFDAGAQSKIITANIKVYGNCILCKARIEKALDHAGIKKAVWSPETKMLSVVYNSTKISEQQICDLLAAAGHDTEKAKATVDAYALLPFCCLYRNPDTGKLHSTHSDN